MRANFPHEDGLVFWDFRLKNQIRNKLIETGLLALIYSLAVFIKPDLKAGYPPSVGYGLSALFGLAGILWALKNRRSDVALCRELGCESITYTQAPSIRDQVSEFHRAMDLPILPHPQIPPDDRVRLRLNLITEEFFETIRAALKAKSMIIGPESVNALDHAEHIVRSSIKTCEIQVNLPEFIDGLADLDYVVEGSRLEFGVNGKPVAAEVHRANMLKSEGPVREDGKRLKPPGFVPPDVTGKLKEQGWKP